VTPSTAEEHTVRFHFILSFHFAARHVHNICIPHESHIFHENADSIHAIPVSRIKYQERNVDGEFQSHGQFPSSTRSVFSFDNHDHDHDHQVLLVRTGTGTTRTPLHLQPFLP
jgi:hypothetical protein